MTLLRYSKKVGGTAASMHDVTDFYSDVSGNMQPCVHCLGKYQ